MVQTDSLVDDALRGSADRGHRAGFLEIEPVRPGDIELDDRCFDILHGKAVIKHADEGPIAAEALLSLALPKSRADRPSTSKAVWNSVRLRGRSEMR